MNDSRLQRLCENHAVFTNSELVSFAYETTAPFETWEIWFDHVLATLGKCNVDKLCAAADAVSKDHPADIAGFSVGYITPERPVSLNDGIFVPMEFLEFMRRRMGTQSVGFFGA
jgi:hypothetical protein